MVRRKAVSLPALQAMKQQGEKIAMLTCYDATFAHILDQAGIDVLLVGDSLGMVLQGGQSTLAVSMEQMAYHTRCVAQALPSALILADMPFGSYQTSVAAAFDNAVKLMQAGAQMVKIEGGEVVRDTVAYLVARGVPVCAHLGLTPQSVHQLGGYRVQGKEEASATQLLHDALALEAAGASLLVLELVPSELAQRVSQELRIPVIGIGAGAGCDGQVLVLHDMLGLNTLPKPPKFVKNFLAGQESIAAAVAAYRDAVKSGQYPSKEHSH